jgi:hypothetical protein
VLIYKLFTVYVFVQTLACGCGPDRRREGFEVGRREYMVRRVGRMPEEIPENSGLALYADGNLWTHQDAGFGNNLFKVTQEGKLLEKQPVPGTSNIDWEDLARDEQGFLYIGDFGNNLNKRRDLRIFKVPEKTQGPADTLQFSYADQKAFPPGKEDLNFDAEAFFWLEGNLYVFSKNRRVKAPMRVYKLPDAPGRYAVAPADSLRINAMITGADVNPVQRQVALLGYGKLYLFDYENPDSLFGGRRVCIPIPRSGQAEAVVYLPDHSILFTNEGGKIFRLSKKADRKR